MSDSIHEVQPFEGIRVIDMTHVFAGPFCTYQLAVLGADVIKVEPPDNPDMTRGEGVVPELNEQGMGTAYLAQNGGKRAIAVDIKTPEGIEILKKLVASADVLVENYTGGTLEELGLGYDALAAVNPQLIYCSMTGFGHTGPKGSDRAYDVVIQAYSGIMAANGEANAPPVRVGPPMVDYGTGAQAALAVSSALFQRSRTGKGQRIDVAMLDAALMSMSALVAGTRANGAPPVPHGNTHPACAGYATYETKDGLLMIGAWSNRQMGALYRLLGDEDRASRTEATARSDIGSLQSDDAAFLRAVLRDKTADNWERLLNAAGVPAARVRRLDETVTEAQLASRGVLQTYPGSDAPGMPKSLPVAGFTYAHGGPALGGRPPRTGEHTAEVLESLGYDAAAIAALTERGVLLLNGDND
ncbi:MAG: CaiB/BaiF CoA-transferase family protein [Rhodospirillaceae bacterium]|nr:CaiB/BaiF CoA-transferase family protein [Rhodospirillaceae bacterium]MDD9914888.1 CaiB/BaiF CoA-transferase family protein [Rhodospirillaceae bacterium]MDD9925837.1 CaiB/BaiF CoA-transferase family protein [Rhodospirillaceae bacterium]